METWTQVFANAAFFIGPLVVMVAAQEWSLRREARRYAADLRNRGRR